VLNAAQEAAFESYIEAGGGYAGVHAAADTEYGWSWYGGLVGAYFQSHPAIQQAKVDVSDRTHPSTRDVPAEWTRTDEWYTYRTNPRSRTHVLATLDEDTYSGGGMGDHPIAWCHAYDGGRSWYTGMGHTAGSYEEDDFLEHVLEGVVLPVGPAGVPRAGLRPDSLATHPPPRALDAWRTHRPRQSRRTVHGPPPDGAPRRPQHRGRSRLPRRARLH